MVKKVKRFIVFFLFSFLYSLFGKPAEAATVCLVPKDSDGKLKYNGASTATTASDFAGESWCY